MKHTDTLAFTWQPMATTKKNLQHTNNDKTNISPSSRTVPSRFKKYRWYKQCYLPTVGYPLLATVIPVAQLNKQQGPATTIFLTKMGYPWSFPRVVACAPKNHGGMGLWLFGTEQGLHKILQILQHIWTNTSIGKVYGIVIQSYQLMSDLSQPILQDTRTLPWSNSPWLDTTQQFLHSIQSMVLLNSPWTTTNSMIDTSWMTS